MCIAWQLGIALCQLDNHKKLYGFTQLYLLGCSCGIGLSLVALTTCTYVGEIMLEIVGSN